MTLLDYGIKPMTLIAYISQRPLDLRVCILRHDVDRKPINALKMAKLESNLKIKSTYYFRYPYTFMPDIIRNISDMGHEIGYHYETLAKAKGDYEKAINLFEMELEEFRKIVDVETICMHGSPLSKYDNRDLWKKYDFRDLGIKGEAYLTMVKQGTRYLSDTGRSWNGKHSLRDTMPGTESLLRVESTDDLIDHIANSTELSHYLTVHPERWALGNKEWIIAYAKDLAMNAGKTMIMKMR